MSLSREEVLHVAKLARIALTEEEVTRFGEQLSQIIGHFDVLNQLDTEGVPPTTHTLPLHNVMAPDEPRPSLDQDQVLANAPSAQEGHLRVRAVLED